MTTNNHPAHGPVSIDRLHQISEILSKAAAQSDGGNLGYAMADAVKVIDSAIAAFGAEPVAYMYKDGDDIEYNGHNEFSGGGKGVPLYAAPQPAPRFIPAELTREEYKRRFMEEENFDDTFRGGWNACRAAMLQGKSDAGERLGTQFEEVLIQTIDASMQAGNSPAVTDGWVMVPVEPTAEMYDAGDRQLATKQVWDAMIAAAPQQEVK
ncbi:hypothetical protein HV032_15155 [Citrobacter freundii]|nr:hypothetical protein HV032_15155 [Citrobacter freundii]